MQIEFILSEFWGEQGFDPSIAESFRQYFPDARYVLYSDKDIGNAHFDEVRIVEPICDPERWRSGWRNHNYFQAIGLRDSQADISIAIDSDMLAVSPAVQSIIPLTKRFGLCLPANPRLTVRHDAKQGADGSDAFDESSGYGYAFATALVSFYTRSARAREAVKSYCFMMENNKEKPIRACQTWWNAAWATCFMPCLLPPQWCVCGENIGCRGEIILHMGHEEVRSHYHQYTAIHS